MIHKLTWKGMFGSVALPAAAMILFYSFVVYVRISLGRWPNFGEHLGSRAVDFYDAASRRSFLVLLCSLYAVPVFIVLSLFFRRWRHLALYFLSYAVAVGLAIGSVFLAPHQFLNWLFD